MFDRFASFSVGLIIVGIGWLMHDSAGAALIFFGGLVAIGAVWPEASER